MSAIRGHALRRPGQTALVWLRDLTEPDGQATYAELDDAAAAVAAALSARAAPGDRIILFQPPGLGFVTAFLGCLYAGCVPVPVYPLLDSEENTGLVRRIATDCGARSVWVPDDATARAAEAALDIPALWETTAERHLPVTAEAPDAPAFLQYTSGSTGTPKGVVVTHGNLAANLAAITSAFRHDTGTTLLSWLPAYHDMGLIGNILHPLTLGCRAYLASPLDFVRRPLAWIESISRLGVTTSGGPNFGYDLVIRDLEREGVPDVDLRHWRTAYSGAERVSPHTLRRFTELLAPRGFHAEAFVPCYGLAESTLLVTSVTVGRGFATGTSSTGVAAVSCGEPRDCEVVITDPAGRRLQEGEIGEIRVSGPSVARGYWRGTGAAAHDLGGGDVFDTAVDGGERRWLRTGDLGFLSGGELYVTGRIKDVIVARGRNHDPVVLERSAIRTVAAFRPGCVAAFGEPCGDGVVIVGELRPGRALTSGDQRRLAAEVASTTGLRLADVLGVPRGSVPKTTSGKLRRHACRERYVAGEYEPHRPPPTARPDEPVEQAARPEQVARTVMAAVTEILGRPVEPDEPLTGHGLDSLGAVRLAGLLARGTGADVPVRFLLHRATAQDVARVVTGTAHPLTAAPAQAATGTGADPDMPGATGGPLSKAQESLLFLHLLDPASAEYNISFAWELAPGHDHRALEEALRAAVASQPELSMRIVQTDEGPRRIPVPARAMEAALVMSPTPVGEEQMRERLADAAGMPFALDTGPLVRVHVWRGPRRRVYQLVVHHIVTDLWSLCLLLETLADSYRALAAGGAPPARSVVRYDDYVRAQHEYLASPAAAERDERLRALLPRRARSLQVRTDHSPGRRRSTHVGRVRRTLPAEVGTALASLDSVALLTAVWMICLHRYGTPDPVVVGVPVTGRSSGRYADVAGLCTNTVPLALRIEPGQRLSGLVAETRRQLLDGLDAGMYPLARAVEAVRPEREPGRSPLVESLITVHESPLPSVAGFLDVIAGLEGEVVLDGLALRGVPVPPPSCRYDLDLMVTPRQGGHLLTLDYAAALFTRETAEAVLGTYSAMVERAVADPDGLVSGLFALPESDRTLLKAIGSADEPPLDPPALARVREVVRCDPGAPAVVAGTRTLARGDFLAQVDRVAAALVTRCGTATAHAALLVEPGPDFVVALYAAWTAGVGALPLPVEFPDARLRGMVADCRPQVLLTTSDLVERARGLSDGDPAPVVLELDRLSGAPPAPPPPNPRAPAFTVFTSGSTGRPKGVTIRHDQLAPLIAWSGRTWRLGPWARIAQTLSLGFDFGLQELFTVLPYGGCVVVPDRQDRASARAYAEFLRRERISVLFSTPTYAGQLAAAGVALPGLRLVLLGGEVLTGSTVDALRAHLDRRCRIFNGYGPTEATVNCLMYEVPDGPSPSVVPVGRASAAATITIVDKHGHQAPVGAIGEIVIGGPGVADGYVRADSPGAGRFTPDPDRPDGRLYRTGDQGFAHPGGTFVVVGRADRQVKVRGFRVEPEEVEHAVRSAPGVRAATVRAIGRPPRLVAFLAAPAADPAAIRDHLRNLLPESMVPEQYVLLDHLPVTATGKLDDDALAAAADTLAPPRLPDDATPAEVEDAVCRVWADAIGVGELPADVNVFDAGAHSLAATRVHAVLENVMGGEFPIHDLFNYPRPRELARRLMGVHASTRGPLQRSRQRRPTADKEDQ
ncbi:amino acid adenylation domain-containing protein [Spongiactinospora sp. 9N601]|uniref:amino acid adenylation domain-containing protein n=1 Tax=Spongiactinospora sp. 9N601 TaxID=3375149 RepID=UPI0037B40F7D